MISTIFYIKGHKWMTKTFDSFTQAYEYSLKRINEKDFYFRKICVFNYETKKSYTIDNIKGKGTGREISSDVMFFSTEADIQDLLEQEL